MTNKRIITHPSEEHDWDDNFVWSRIKDMQIEAWWVGENRMSLARPERADGAVQGWSSEHILPVALFFPHHGSCLRDTCDKPPKVAERLLELIPLKYRDHLVGDLHEIYHSDLRERGLQEAQRRYWKQVLLSLVPVIWTVLKEVAGLAVLLKLIK